MTTASVLQRICEGGYLVVFASGGGVLTMRAVAPKGRADSAVVPVESADDDALNRAAREVAKQVGIDLDDD